MLWGGRERDAHRHRSVITKPRLVCGAEIFPGRDDGSNDGIWVSQHHCPLCIQKIGSTGDRDAHRHVCISQEQLNRLRRRVWMASDERAGRRALWVQRVVEHC